MCPVPVVYSVHSVYDYPTAVFLSDSSCNRTQECPFCVNGSGSASTVLLYPCVIKSALNAIWIILEIDNLEFEPGVINGP